MSRKAEFTKWRQPGSAWCRTGLAGSRSLPKGRTGTNDKHRWGSTGVYLSARSERPSRAFGRS